MTWGSVKLGCLTLDIMTWGWAQADRGIELKVSGIGIRIEPLLGLHGDTGPYIR